VKRADGARELLDGPLEAATLEGNLRDLTRFNRLLGGASLSWSALRSVLGDVPAEQPIELLDVGTGAADIPRELLRRSQGAPLRLRITATDVRPEVVASARSRSTEVKELTIALGRVDRLDYPADSFDVVHSSLLMHHLEPEAARRLLAEMGRVARLAVIISDLERTRLWWLAAWLMSHLLTRNRYTRHDAPLSVRRAYTAAEVRQMTAGVGLREVAHHGAVFGHRYAIVFAPPANHDE
jgi:ubiquinone/menaquinone biosynthesis C-methylase UbiE